MKNKILIIALSLNLIAGSFILYGFVPKEKKVNDAGGQYITVIGDLDPFGSSVEATDGTITTDVQKMKYKEFNHALAQELNNVSGKGYELVTSSSFSHEKTATMYYVFKKK